MTPVWRRLINAELAVEALEKPPPDGYERVPAGMALVLAWALEGHYTWDPSDNGFLPQLFKSPVEGVLPSNLYVAACEKLGLEHPLRRFDTTIYLQIIKQVEALLIEAKEGRITAAKINTLAMACQTKIFVTDWDK